MPLATILLPGLDGTGRLFGPLLDALPIIFVPTVVAYPTDIALGYTGLTNFVGQHLPADRPFAIVAESFSGPIAIRLAAEHPEHLVALVLAGSFVQHPLGGMSPWIAPLIHSVLFRLPPPRWAVRHLVAGADASEELVSDILATLRSLPPHVLIQRVRDVLSVDVTEDFNRCTVPTLYLSGTCDRLLSPAIPKQLQALRPDLTVVRLDAPHLILQRQPTKAAQLIADFIVGRRECRDA